MLSFLPLVNTETNLPIGGNLGLTKVKFQFIYFCLDITTFDNCFFLDWILELVLEVSIDDSETVK